MYIFYTFSFPYTALGLLSKSGLGNFYSFLNVVTLLIFGSKVYYLTLLYTSLTLFYVHLKILGNNIPSGSHKREIAILISCAINTAAMMYASAIFGF